MKRLALITLTIGATLLGITLLWQFRPALELFGGSLAVSAALRPLVRRLEGRGINRGVAILIWYALILALFSGFVFLYGLGLSTDISRSVEQLPRLYDSLRESWRDGSPVQQALTRGLPDFDELIAGGQGGEELIVVGETALGFAGRAVGGVVILLATLSLAFYWLAEVTHFERLWLSVLPVATRVRARDIWRTTEDAVGAYIRSTVVAITMAGLLLLALYTSIGYLPSNSVTSLPFATLLALIGGLSHLVPRIGPAIGLLLAVAVAATLSPIEALVVLVGGGAIQVLTHHVAMWLIGSGAAKVNPLLQVLLLLALAELGGLGAMIFAPPLAALVQVLYYNLRATPALRPVESNVVELLVQRLERLRNETDPDSKEFASALRRSDELLKQAREMLEKSPARG